MILFGIDKDPQCFHFTVFTCASLHLFCAPCRVDLVKQAASTE